MRAESRFPLHFDVGLVLACAPLFWALGISLLAFHVLSVALFLRVAWSTRSQGLRVPLVAWLLLLLSLLLVVSATLNATGRIDRLAPAVYNATFWTVGALLVVTVTNSRTSTREGIERIGSIALLLLLTLAPLGVLATIALDEQLVLPSAAGLFLDREGLPTLVRDSMQMKILSPDWIAGEESVRLTLLAPYPTAVAGMAIGLLGLAHLRVRPAAPAGIAATSAAALLCILCASRVGAGALLVYLGALAWFSLPLRGLQKLALLLLAGLLLLVFLLATGILSSALAWALDVRGGSSLLRFLLYTESISAVLDGNPLIGQGVKVRGFVGTVPLGSHSTYVGVLYRGGFLGLLILTLLVAAIIAQTARLARAPVLWLRARSDVVASALLAYAAFLVFEDLDAPQLVSFLFFVLLGIGQLGGPADGAPVRERAVLAPA